MEDLQFDKPVWNLNTALHWIAFGRRQAAPETGFSIAKFEQAEVDLLEKWQGAEITLRGLEYGRGNEQEIPRDFSAQAAFEPLSNTIQPKDYLKDRHYPDAPWQEVFLYRDDVLALWPDTPWPDQSAPQTQEAPEPSDKKEKQQAKHKPDVEGDAKLKNRIEMVLAKARTKWSDSKKRPEIDVMARELERLDRDPKLPHKERHGYKFEAIRKILSGTYKTSVRLKIAGL